MPPLTYWVCAGKTAQPPGASVCGGEMPDCGERRGGHREIDGGLRCGVAGRGMWGGGRTEEEGATEKDEGE